MNQQVVQENITMTAVFDAIEKLKDNNRKLVQHAESDREENEIYERFTNDLIILLTKTVVNFHCHERNLKQSFKKRMDREWKQALSAINRYQKAGDVRLLVNDLNGITLAEPKYIMEMINHSNIEVDNEKNATSGEANDLRHQINGNDLSTFHELEAKIRDLERINDDSKVLISGLQAELANVNMEQSDKAKKTNTILDNIIKKRDVSPIEGFTCSAELLDPLKDENQALREEITQFEKKLANYEKNDHSDIQALVFEIADKHDHIVNLRAKNRRLEARLEHLERKVQFREKIIRELRRAPKNVMTQSISPISMTPPRTPELKISESCSSNDLESNLIVYRSNYLTVPGQQQTADSCYSLSDYDQDSTIGKSASEINFCDDENGNKDEIERLHQMINEMESENGCNRLLITRLEDEHQLIRKSEMRIKQDRDLKAEKLSVLKYKFKLMGNRVLGNSSEEIMPPKLHHNDLSLLEDELKPELDILNSLVKVIDTTRQNLANMSDENRHLIDTISKLKVSLFESQHENKQLRYIINDLRHPRSFKAHDKAIMVSPDALPHHNNDVDSKNVFQIAINETEHPTTKERHSLAKLDVMPTEPVSDVSSSPESESTDNSLSNAHSLSEVINDWKRELESKNVQLKDKISSIQMLESQLRDKDSEIYEVRTRCKSIEIDRDKNWQMVNQLKNAIQTHNESIQFLKHQNVALKAELDEHKSKMTNNHEYYDHMLKRNQELESENKNQHMTIANLRTAIEDLKRRSGNGIQPASDVIETLNLSINLLTEQLNESYKENITKEEQLELLRDANLTLRSQAFDLNQDFNDLLEIVEVQKNRRMLEVFKIAQKEEEREIEKEISNRERDINCLKHFRSRCAEIETEYLEKMATQKHKSDSTIKELESEITALTEQLIQSHQQTSHYDELMKQTAVIQNSMQDLESQNDMLRKTVESYEHRFSEIQVQLEKIQFENSSLITEIDNLKSDISDRNKRISELSLDHHKLEAEYEMQKKSCNCSSPKSSPEKRATSTIVQMNDLKTKLMNKSLEHSKVTESLKRKTLQYEKLQKTAFDEKNRLREECLKSIQTIGELKSKISLLEIRVQEQNEEVISSRDRVNQALSKMNAMDSELQSKSAKLEDLETREEKWRVHAYEITHEIKNRKEDAFKREQKLIQEINMKTNSIKDQSRIVMQHETTIHHLKSENETLKNANSSLNQRIAELRKELEELKVKEKGLCELLDRTEEELKTIKQEVFHLFNTSAIPEIKNVHGQMKNENVDLQAKYQTLVSDYNKLIDENQMLYEIKNDTISAIEIFKKLQDESTEREKVYQQQIAKLQTDKRNLHKDRTRLTTQLLHKHRDMIILNSEIDKFKDNDYDDGRSISHNSLQPFAPVMYPSAVATLFRSTSNPDLATDPIALDARNITEKLIRTRKFWQHGIRTAVSSIAPAEPPNDQPNDQTDPAS